jgi:hypothetical protein
MKAASFLDMVTLLTATAKSDKEIDSKLSKLILLYNQPPKNLCSIFSNLHQLEICEDDYFDREDNTIHFDDKIFSMHCDGKQYIHKVPRNINELITAINNSNATFRLEFKDSVVKELDFNGTFKDLMEVYGL